MLDRLETYLGIDARQACSQTATLDDEPLGSWIFDINDSQTATLGDVLAVAPFFNLSASTDGAKRHDWNGDGFVSLSDVLAISSVFNNKCLPLVAPQ